MKNIPARIGILITRKITWTDEEDGSETTEKVSLKFAWIVVGIHSYKWWWVRKYGRLPCGCTRNPLTRRMVLYRWKCPANHMKWDKDGPERDSE